MHWQDKVKQVICLEEKEIPLYQEIASIVPSGVKRMINCRIEQEKKGLEELRQLLYMYGKDSYYDEPYGGYATKEEEKKK
ncbi:MAG: hypothetical protein PWP31_1214 [Clostridia bacterium]|nr:hypothetical protein [Clostridia bacterium]